MNAVTKLSVLLQLLPAIYGAIELSCGATHPRLPSSMTCLCKRKAGIGIDWFSNDTFRSNCLLSSGCLPPRNGSIFSINETEYVYNMTVSSYSYSECQRFTCKDVSNSSIQQNKTPSAIAFDSTTPTYITEPVSNHTSGNISITTSCISGYSDLRIKWFKIVDASREPYIPDPTKEIYDLDQSSCTSCNNESAATLTVGFRHEEVAVGTDTQEVQFELEISHPDFLLNALDRITRNVYEIKGSSPCEISCDIVCIRHIVCGICFFIVVFVGCLLLYVMLRLTGKEDNTEDKWSTSYIEILLNTLSVIIWIVIAALFIWSLRHCCSCENTCECCEIVLKIRIVLGILLGIHLILWLILIFVLYNRKDKGENEGDIHFKTKLEKVRITFSTMPLAGLFPVCGWLIRIYRCEKCAIHDKQLTTEKKKRQLPSTTEPNLPNIKTKETEKKKHQLPSTTEPNLKNTNKKETEKKKHQLPSLTEPNLTNTKIKETEKKKRQLPSLTEPNLTNTKTKETEKKKHQFPSITEMNVTNTKTKETEKKKHQLPSTTETNLTNTKTKENEKTKHQLPNLSNTETEETGKQNSKRDKTELDKISQFMKAISSSEKENEVSAADFNGVKPNGTDTVKHSRSSMSGEISTKRNAFVKADSEVKTNKQKGQNQNSAFTKSGTKQLSQNSGNVITSSQEQNVEQKMNVPDNQTFVSYPEEKPQRKMDETKTKTKTGSENKPGSKDDIKREEKKSRKAEDENKNPQNNSMVGGEAHTGKMDLTKTKTGSENKPGSKDDVRRKQKKSSKAEYENKNPQNTNMGSAEAHTGSETMKRALSANFHDDQDDTPTVSIDSRDSNMTKL